MSETVSREIISQKVIEALQQATDHPDKIEENDRIFEDLGMNRDFHGAMAVPYSKISIDYGGKSIGSSEIVNNRTVSSDVDLVYKKANKR
jgi:hypothetical protein